MVTTGSTDTRTCNHPNAESSRARARGHTSSENPLSTQTTKCGSLFMTDINTTLAAISGVGTRRKNSRNQFPILQNQLLRSLSVIQIYLLAI